MHAEPKATPRTPLLPVDDALALLRERLRPLRTTERVALPDAARRVLAVDVRADRDQPDFDRSMMDGVAVRSVECAAAENRLRVVGESPAGAPYAAAVEAGTAVRVMTGGVVPPGADAVVPVERTRSAEIDGGVLAGATLIVEGPVHAEQHIARKGSEVVAGARVLAAGQRVDGARLGVLASFGVARPEVVRRPRVGLLPTGDEIVRVDQQPAPGQVRDSNRWSLAALLDAWGAEVMHGEVAVDRKDAVADAVRHLAGLCDIVVLSGGVSMGDYDLVGGALASLGAEVVFHRVKMRPGKPVLCAFIGETLILGLPGNPVSSVVAAHLFLRPALCWLEGEAGAGWRSVAVPLTAPLHSNGPREAFLPGRWVATADGSLGVEPVRTAGSADLAGWADSDVLIRQAPLDPGAEAGASADVLVWTRR
ncbi:MAG: molybdopterin molybdotransferase MoeA [Deltaproteobacteria bacterium]|nr:molybdopterin molybdotransferase MoeA [Deltaproteobacteria bacterium]